MIRDIRVPPWVRRGIMRNDIRHKDREIFGADTETIDGEPYAFQVYGNDPAHRTVTFVNRRTVTDRFLRFLWTLPSRSVLFLHNLEFDLPVLLYPYIDAFKDSNFELGNRTFKVEVLCGKVNHASFVLRQGRTRKTYELVDTFAFFKSSLASLAETFELPGKMKKPRKLGSVRYKGKELDYFIAYALRDAEVAYELGLRIVDFHRAQDVRLTMSAPQLSARIFKHRYIPKEKRIPANPQELERAAVLSYHGGKNGFYGKPGIFKGVRVYDINSAYPYAFTQLPNFLNCDYHHVLEPSITEWRKWYGIVCASGVSEPKTYNLLRDHAFKPIYGPFERVWFTSYEWSLALKHGFVRDHYAHEAWEVIPAGQGMNGRNHEIANPLRGFAEDFFKLKSESKGAVREFYKIVLNSLYGKFIQNVADNGEGVLGNEETIHSRHVAGGLWNPLIASLITGFVRAYLTELEIAFGAIHSSTDSVATTRKDVPIGSDLGGMSLKAVGTGLFLRPKLYVVWDHNRAVQSFALHGFHGTLRTFLRLVRSGKRLYFHQRITKVKESRRQGMKPLVMKSFFKRVNLELDAPLPVPKLLYKGQLI